MGNLYGRYVAWYAAKRCTPSDREQKSSQLILPPSQVSRSPHELMHCQSSRQCCFEDKQLTFLYLCFFIFNFLCLFTLIIRYVTFLFPGTWTAKPLRLRCPTRAVLPGSCTGAGSVGVKKLYFSRKVLVFTTISALCVCDEGLRRASSFARSRRPRAAAAWAS